MTEEEARDWIASRFGGQGVDRLTRLAAMIVVENEAQNLIAPSTVTTIWARHLVDSAQLVELAPAEGLWIDIGTGGGFPGMVVGLLRDAPTLLVEPRRRRAVFLQYCANMFDTANVRVAASRIEQLAERGSVISARAVAAVAPLFDVARHCATRDTLWLLPRGRDTVTQIAEAEQRWRGVFHVKQSVTSPDSTILVATEVEPK